MTIYTIGHSTRTFDDFLTLLRAHGIAQLADVRTVPKSRRHPHFAQDALAQALPEAGVAYRHFRDLGGLRKPRADSRNTAWRHPSFRGYADHMQTAAFERALDELVVWAREIGDPERVALHAADRAGDPERVALHAADRVGDPERVALQEPDVGRPFQGRHTVVMCAEAVWWQCHRQLIADALVARGIDVRHIMSAASAPAHRLTDFARVKDSRVTYPGVF